jgi:hypothetical protein
MSARPPSTLGTTLRTVGTVAAGALAAVVTYVLLVVVGR